LADTLYSRPLTYRKRKAQPEDADSGWGNVIRSEEMGSRKRKGGGDSQNEGRKVRAEGFIPRRGNERRDQRSWVREYFGSGGKKNRKRKRNKGVRWGPNFNRRKRDRGWEACQEQSGSGVGV